jgi:copper transport protein
MVELFMGVSVGGGDEDRRLSTADDMCRRSLMQLLILIISSLALWMANVPTPVACAHAVPLSSIPAPNAGLAQVPQEITLRFSERVEARASSLQVFNAHGQRIDDGNAAVEPGNPWLYRVGLQPAEGGAYTVSWRVMSADDGHVTEGAYVFVVGESVVPRPSAVGQMIAVTGWWDALARWIGMLSTAALIGLLTASVVFWRRQLSHIPQPSHLLPWLAALLLGGSLTLLARMHQITPEESLWTGIGMLMSTTVGAILAAKIGLIIGLTGVLVAYWCVSAGRRWLWALALVLLVLLLISDTLVSHSAATIAWRSLAIGAQLVHLVGVALWVGGLGYFATLFWWSVCRERSVTSELAWTMPTFSLLAVGAVGLLTVSGLYLTQLHLGSVDQLISTPYGRTLLAKLGVVALMVGLGGYHQCIVQRRMLAGLGLSGGSTGLVSQRFKRTLRIEAILGVLALLLAAFLGTTSPPTNTPSPITETFRQVQDVDDAQVMLEIWPLRPGPNTIRLSVTDRAGHVLTDATAALLQLQSEASETAPISFILDREAAGVFVKNDAVLGIEGRWKGQVTVQRQGAYDLHDGVELMLTSQSEPHAPASSAASPGAGASFVYVGITGVTIFLFLMSKRRLSSALQHIDVTTQRRVSHPDRR